MLSILKSKGLWVSVAITVVVLVVVNRVPMIRNLVYGTQPAA